jgi:ABC-type transporter Mla subunit MlaD
MFCQYTLRAKAFQTVIVKLKKMADSSSDGKTFDALSGLVSVLVEHEKNLDQLINGLSTVIGQLNKNEKINGQMDMLFDKIMHTEKQITDFVNELQADPPENATPALVKDTTLEAKTVLVAQESPRTTLRCVQWKDFQKLAYQAQTVTFNLKEGENTFEVYALKNSQLITYVGLISQLSSSLKVWLARQVNISEEFVFEGSLKLINS